ncbi:MAG: transporter substrate-binding domain-containing protein, partial [Lachnospiraceae bacterium]|nr:transporter substrate-binding domain-containing protein [Lachnospiraceae bacterium]
MKKVLAFLLVAVMVLSLAACGKEEEFTFKHGFDLDYPPYSFLNDDGSVGGFDVEFAQAVCEKLGWKYESVP